MPSLLRPRTIEAADLRHDGNIFNLLRLILSSAVIWSHAFALLGQREADPSLIVLPFTISRLAVLLFFTLSGFLVVQSLIHRGPRNFAIARALRMLPGLWVMLIITSAIVLLAFTTVPPLQNPGWWAYIARNLLLQSGGYFIDGAFTGQASPALVNGSLWTISREVQCYIALGLLGAAGLLRQRSLLLVAWLIAIAVHMALPRDIIPFLTELRWLAISFFAGVLLSLWQDHVPLSAPLAVALPLLASLVPPGPWAELVMGLAAAYALIALGILAPAPLKRLSGRLPDYSYGIYVYAFPAQQIAIATGLGLTPATNMLASFALALPFAIASWHLIEKPTLARKPAAPRLTQPAPPPTHPA